MTFCLMTQKTAISVTVALSMFVATGDTTALTIAPAGLHLVLPQNKLPIVSVSDHGGGESRGDVTPVTVISVDDDATTKIVEPLAEANTECGSIDVIYRLDCAQQAYKSAVKAVPKHSDYQKARRDLYSAQRKLNKLLKKNLDKTVAPLKVGNKTYRAVKKTVAKSLNAQATVVLEETATKLLRSAGNSKKRQLHYAQIADVVGSNKKIFRS
jgi:hypothetical protein